MAALAARRARKSAMPAGLKNAVAAESAAEAEPTAARPMSEVPCSRLCSPAACEAAGSRRLARNVQRSKHEQWRYSMVRSPVESSPSLTVPNGAWKRG